MALWALIYMPRAVRVGSRLTPHPPVARGKLAEISYLYTEHGRCARTNAKERNEHARRLLFALVPTVVSEGSGSLQLLLHGAVLGAGGNSCGPDREL